MAYNPAQTGMVWRFVRWRWPTVRLSLSFLGSFQVTLDGRPITGFESAKVRALLAYLAVEAEHAHPREVLAGLLWPDWPQDSAFTNLRRALSNLRESIGDRQVQPPFLLISREALQFNTASDCSLDVRAFGELLAKGTGSPPGIKQLEQAVALYRGHFLAGFTVSDSPPFEEWALLQREALDRVAMAALRSLTTLYEQERNYARAEVHARRQVQLQPLDEEGQRQLMRALALSGQRSAALAQYQACSRLLAEELGVEPAQETVALYERIRAGELHAAVPRPSAPTGNPTSFLGGRYTVSQLIGEGAKKRVYRAHDALLDREVAFALIKVTTQVGMGMVSPSG